MRFTYQACRNLLKALQEKYRVIWNYQGYKKASRCAILGRDIVAGYGASAAKDISSNQTVVGNPAKPFVRKKE